MSISKDQAIEAIKTLKEYCGDRKSCPDCGVRDWCDDYVDVYDEVYTPDRWEVPND